MSDLRFLNELRAGTVRPLAEGLGDQDLERFLSADPLLAEALALAESKFSKLRLQYRALLKGDEAELIKVLQEKILNFYPPESVSPYVPLAARGPWIVTITGAVIYDTGGYGMLGFGHADPAFREVLGEPFVMANVMTASFSQYRFVQLLNEKIGSTRGGSPYIRYACINSGSEAMTLATRLSDAHARIQTDPGAKHHGKKIIFLALERGFHGRTGRPAQASSSTLRHYQILATFRDRKNLVTVPMNDIAALEERYAAIEREGAFVEAMLFEPVMGEGNPGVQVTPEFYARARDLTRVNDSLLIADSIQSGLRAHGVLSIVDYPGFDSLEAPDMESFSKALNAGQYPLSVLALTEAAANLYKPGIYGNTMTANPRALEVAAAVLERATPQLAANIRSRGEEFLEKLSQVKERSGGAVTKVQGTGLILSAELREGLPVVGSGGVEERMRLKGVQVIHGGKNSLRFTPHFHVNSAEIDLVVSVMEQSIKEVLARSELKERFA